MFALAAGLAWIGLAVIAILGNDDDRRRAIPGLLIIFIGLAVEGLIVMASI